jgi:hypothetical protein
MNKYKKLIVGIILDAIGYVSFFIPGIGEFADVVWAPISAYLMTKLYKGKTGKIAAAIAFIEEALPGLDVIPTFTLMWLYSYVFKSKEDRVIEV